MAEEIVSVVTAALETACLPFTIHGAIPFGSNIRGSARSDSDIDLVVVAEGINPKLHRRSEEIFLIKKVLPYLPLDVLLFTPDEVRNNFENHNPLFLDIAEDGLILLDRDDFLSDLIATTRGYVRLQGITRLSDGWRFPVKERSATFLSNVSNRDFAMAMLRDGERDYLIGEKLTEAGFYDKAVYHYQQAVEKCVKSVLAAFGVFQKSHYVGEKLLGILQTQGLAEDWRARLTRSAEISEKIEPEVSLSRYPRIINDALWLPSAEYEKSDAEKAGEMASEVLLTAQEFCRYWFQDEQGNIKAHGVEVP